MLNQTACINNDDDDDDQSCCKMGDHVPAALGDVQPHKSVSKLPSALQSIMLL